MTDAKLPQQKRVTRRRTPEPAQEEPEEVILSEEPEPIPVKNAVKKPRQPLFRRGKSVLCLLVSPGERTPELIKLRKTEDTITDQHDDRTFIVSAKPALRIRNRTELLDCYVIDAGRGCTVDVAFDRDKQLAMMHTNPETVYDLIDQNFLSQFVDLKPDWKSQMGFGVFCGVVAFLAGLMF